MRDNVRRDADISRARDCPSRSRPRSSPRFGDRRAPRLDSSSTAVGNCSERAWGDWLGPGRARLHGTAGPYHCPGGAQATSSLARLHRAGHRRRNAAGRGRRQRDGRVSVPDPRRSSSRSRRSPAFACPRAREPRREWAPRRRTAASWVVGDQPLRQDLRHGGSRRRRPLRVRESRRSLRRLPSRRRLQDDSTPQEHPPRRSGSRRSRAALAV